MSWEQETFIEELSNGAIREFISRSVDDEWLIKTYGSTEKAVEVASIYCSENQIVDECIDEILSIILTCVLDREPLKEY